MTDMKRDWTCAGAEALVEIEISPDMTQHICTRRYSKHRKNLLFIPLKII